MSGLDEKSLTVAIGNALFGWMGVQWFADESVRQHQVYPALLVATDVEPARPVGPGPWSSYVKNEAGVIVATKRRLKAPVTATITPVTSADSEQSSFEKNVALRDAIAEKFYWFQTQNQGVPFVDGDRPMGVYRIVAVDSGRPVPKSEKEPWVHESKVIVKMHQHLNAVTPVTRWLGQPKLAFGAGD